MISLLNCEPQRRFHTDAFDEDAQPGLGRDEGSMGMEPAQNGTGMGMGMESGSGSGSGANQSGSSDWLDKLTARCQCNLYTLLPYLMPHTTPSIDLSALF